MLYREAHIADIPELMRVRFAVRENRLSNPALVTENDCAEFILLRGKGWVCETEQGIAGFAIADLREDNIWALFVDPEFEGRGIGKMLQRMMLDWFFSIRHNVWLGTAPGTRAEKFYTKTGWTNCGLMKNGEVRFEMTGEQWLKVRDR